MSSSSQGIVWGGRVVGISLFILFATLFLQFIVVIPIWVFQLSWLAFISGVAWYGFSYLYKQYPQLFTVPSEPPTTSHPLKSDLDSPSEQIIDTPPVVNRLSIINILMIVLLAGLGLTLIWLGIIAPSPQDLGNRQAIFLLGTICLVSTIIPFLLGRQETAPTEQGWRRFCRYCGARVYGLWEHESKICGATLSAKADHIMAWKQGENAPEERFCMYCGSQLFIDELACSNCGQPVE